MAGGLRVVAFDPPGVCGSAIAVQAARAGFEGGLSLEYCALLEAERKVHETIAAEIPFAISIGELTPDLKKLIQFAATRGLQQVLLAYGWPRSLKREVKWLRDEGVQALVEVTGLTAAREAAKAGASGIILKGNECAGRVEEPTSFILLQQVVPAVDIPVLARGGISLYSAAAAVAAGAAGVVLDWQLALASDAGIPEPIRTHVARMSGSETAVLGADLGAGFRGFHRPGELGFVRMREKLEQLSAGEPGSTDDVRSAWVAAVHAQIRAESERERFLLIGQDAGFAAELAAEFKTVANICRAVRREARRQCEAAASAQALRSGGPLAEGHGTTYAIAQGPMVRISDTPEFALAVAQAGALPFVSLDALHGADVVERLTKARERLGTHPWGAAVVAMAPPEVREEQIAELIRHPSPFALLTGGRPDQAREMEKAGIRTYLHTPSPGLLAMFLESGTRRFVFEGREAGGLVGPRSSLVLWSGMIRTLLDYIRTSRAAGAEFQVLLAGGIHDARSAAMAMAVAAPLTDYGVRVGVMMSTAYLFTREAVETGAIVAGYQQVACECNETVVLEAGPDHHTRAAKTPYTLRVQAERRKVLAEGRSREALRDVIEAMNYAHLRVAAKGLSRDLKSDKSVDAQTQLQEGLFLMGQDAALRSQVTTAAELHHDVGEGSLATLSAFAARDARPSFQRPSDVAVIGMACLLPGAKGLEEFWRNILSKTDSITEVPAEKWDWKIYFDEKRSARDKVYSRWGGFIDSIPFDPTKYGMPPTAVPSVEPLQLLTLEIVRQAIADAGYENRPFDRAKTCCILGVGGGVADLGNAYGFRTLVPHYFQKAGRSMQEADAFINSLNGVLPEWTEDSFAGLLMNVASGRAANRFDFGGTNFTVDAACASSLAALRQAVIELETGSADVAIAGGSDTMQNPFAFMCFSKTQALSPRGRSRTFDASSDGIVTSEGVAVLVLKRLEDAKRDGDRIYAVIKAVGSSSDGKHKGLTAPRPAGQVRAMERAYTKAGIRPSTLGLVEAHGTGTVAGDQSEIESVSTLLRRDGAPEQSVAIGSVKSQIGHAKCTAGVAGVVKAVLALHNKVLPPTINVAKPHPALDHTALYVNSEPRPWVARQDGAPRRAAVSSFGFGGTNFHAVLEEYTPEDGIVENVPALRRWPGELFAWRAPSAVDLIGAIDGLLAALQQGAQPELVDLAAAICQRYAAVEGPCSLAIVAESLGDLTKKLADARGALAQGKSKYVDPRGIYYQVRRADSPNKLALLFPGQGSQRVDMLRDLAVCLPIVREHWERADRVLTDTLGQPLSRFVYPPPTFTEEAAAAHEEAIKQTRVAQPAVGAADLALFSLLTSLDLKPDMAAGHSYGEFAALCAAGVMSYEDLIRLSEARGRIIVEAAGDQPGCMAAIDADEARVRTLIEGLDDVEIANLNSPIQTVVAGTETAVYEVLRRSTEQGVNSRRIKVSCAFHSAIVEECQGPLGEALRATPMTTPRFPVYSNTTGRPHAAEPDAIRSQLVAHAVSPVRFIDELRAMYDDGARVFVEVGPGRAMSSFAERCLEGRDVTLVTLDPAGRHGLLSLVHGLAQLHAAGIAFSHARLFEERVEKQLDVHRLVEQTKPAPLPLTTWMVNGSEAIPLNGKVQPKPNGAPAATAAGGRLAEVAAAAPPPVVPAPAPTPAPEPVAPAPPAPAALSPVRSAAPPVAVRPAPAYPAVFGTGADAIMGGYQQVMARFLETQRAVMLAYLQGGAASASPSYVDMGYQPQPVMPAIYPAAHSQPTPVPMPMPMPMPVAPGAAPAAVAPIAPAPMVATAPVQAVPAPVVPPAPTPVAAAPVAAAPVAAPPAPAPVAVAPAPAPAAPSPAPAPTAPTVPASGGVTREKLTSALVAVVSDRTGYPPEMLDLDLDLEADLGIDSIKRIEIIGTLQKDGVLPEAQQGDGQLEELSKQKSLNAIINWIVERSGSSGKSLAAGISAEATPAAEPQSQIQRVARLVLSLTDCPLAGAAAPSPNGAVLVVDDSCGIAQTLVDRLVRQGVQAALLTPARAGQPAAPGAVNLSDADALRGALDALHKRLGRVAALVYCAPLGDDPSLRSEDPAAWKPALEAELLGLLHLAQQLESNLRDNGGGRLIVATRMGGTFGSLSPRQAAGLQPIHGGVVGFVKALNREWDNVRCKAVDFETTASNDAIVSALWAELASGDHLSEVGYVGGRRVKINPVAADLAGRPAQAALDPESVLLITGGARGITADIAIDLARRFRPRLVLVGRSKLPPEREEADTEELREPREIKAALLRRLSSAGQKATPALVERHYRGLMNNREMRENLAAMRAAGSPVEYLSCDVASEAEFGGVIDDIYRRYGRLDGVLHGAGVTEDKFLRDKTTESFRRVLSPKVDGAFILARRLRPESLRFFYLFSSVSARYGNRGQADYSAANEILNKLAQRLNARWPGRVCALNWGPWEAAGASGMVSPELAAQFASAGVQMVSRAGGCVAMAEEIVFGRKDEVEVVFGGPLFGGGGGFPERAPDPVAAVHGGPPLMAGAQMQRQSDGSIVVHRDLNTAHDLYLDDHRLDGKPVMPMAMVAELVSEVAAAGWPDWPVVRVVELRVLNGIVLDSGSGVLRVSAAPRPMQDGTATIDLRVELLGAARPRLYYTATVEMQQTPRHLPPPPRLTIVQPRAYPLSIDDSYERWLFHGPLFACIEEIQEVGENGMIARLSASLPQRCLAQAPAGDWMMDPVMVDGGLQMLILWLRLYHDQTPLPARFGRYHRLGPVASGDIRCEMRVVSAAPPEIHTDIAFYGANGALIGFLEDMQFTCSKALNRLAGHRAPAGGHTT